ncbi:hydroxycinnamoyl-CoA shikimate/quinate hydroxycinnamoyl transferase [Hibiscus trionum]|uniref:Hydroxycinnamoyl-CoA shikimate/quinate hydroxycinnamoyl transferase n=1 Tax=Hibiscus trionum TaxID=183268 RepID=A0A9W7LNP9_HIBTR|nr:hydroxycinnamoyl-CoA shikimate/quinate hydroxycinnamoyl transferase [Hibiscus trionum]
MYFPVDGRSRLNPPLPKGYFGNVIFIAAVVTQAEPFTETLKRIHERLKKINDEYLRSALDYIKQVSDLISTLARGPHTFRCPNLAINSWMLLPIYDADFGWGRPVYMGPENVIQEGKIVILPSPTNDGSSSVVTCLETSHVKLFEKFLY